MDLTILTGLPPGPVVERVGCVVELTRDDDRGIVDRDAVWIINVDGQSANLYDMIGLTQGKTPKFSKQYADANSIVESCIKSYSNETEQSEFPAKEHCYEIEEELSTIIEDAIGKIK